MTPMIARVWKPWFVYRPVQLIRRLGAGRLTANGYQAVGTAWGATLTVDPGRAIGHSLVTTGVFDLAVSEAMARLAGPGHTVVDAGANVGYMSVLAAMTVGPAGRVFSFEPHPALAEILRANVARAARGGGCAHVTVHQAALGDRRGTASLLVPGEFATNDGTARVVPPNSTAEPALDVTLCTLDDFMNDVLADSVIDVLKIDVEGAEAQVLAGGFESLAAHRIRHVLFEDHAVERSDAVAILREAGYQVFALGWTMRRLRVDPLADAVVAREYEAPSFIATVDVDHLLASCRAPGWRVLRPAQPRDRR